ALRPELAPLLPELGSAPQEARDRNQLFDAVVRLLAELAQRGIVVVVLDDIQWLDEAAAALLHYAFRADTPRVLFAAAARAAEVGDNAAAAGLVRALRRDGRLL